MIFDDDSLKLAKNQAREIWKIIDYVRGADSISDHRSLAYAIFFICYLQAHKQFEPKKIGSLNGLSIYSCELVDYAVHLGFINHEISHHLHEHLISTLRRVENSSNTYILKALNFVTISTEPTLASISLEELDLLFAENEGRSGGEFYTPKDINDLVTKLGLTYQPMSVCDPFAGAGNTAFSFAKTGSNIVSIDTQEVNSAAYFKLTISRVVKRIKGKDYLGNSLSNPVYNKNQYDLIASFPPFGMKIPKTTRDYIYYNSMTEKHNYWLNITKELPESRSDWFITLSMLSALSAKGKLLIGMTLGAMTRGGSEAKIRRYLVINSIVEKVILLPKNMYYSTSIQTVLLVLNNGLTDEEKSEVRFIDASLFYKPNRGRNLLTPENIDEIVDACNIDGKFSVSSDISQIAEKSFNLDPSLYVTKNLRINELTIKNFRGYSDFKIKMHRNLNIIVGENGAGKTSILEAIACGLGPFLTAMPDAKGKLIKKSDIHISAEGIANFARLSIDTTSSLSWDLVAKGTDTSEPPKIGTMALSSYAANLVETNAEYPLIAYYGTNRALTTVSSKVAINPFEKESRGEGYESALDAKVNYSIIKNWFSKIEVEELRKRDELKDYEFCHPAKWLVSETVYKIVNRATGIEFDKNSNDVVVDWKNEKNESVKLTLEQLSEGYRNMVALTIDLVRRAYLLNPFSSKPLAVKGIVLIDEIELHLHPRWQQKILNDLTHLFNGIQFIVTTHSPQVLTTVESDTIRIVSADSNEAKLIKGTNTYGSESSRMLEEVLGGDSRAQHLEIVKKLNRYAKLVESDQWNSKEALQLKKVLYEWGGQSEIELQRLETDIRIREFERDNEKD